MKITANIFPSDMDRDDELFEQLWPDGVELTEEVFHKIIETKMDINHILKEILPPAKFGELKSKIRFMLNQKEDRTKPFWEECYAKWVPLHKQLEEVKKEATAACQEKIKPIEDEYTQAIIKLQWETIEPFLKLL